MSPLTIYLRYALVVLLAGETVAAQVPRRAAPAPLPAALVPATAVAVADTGQAFTLADLLAYVLLRHPVARQAGLLPARAAQEVRFARGQFDPAFASKYAGKTLGGTAYFHDWDTQLRVPLWFGADVKAGFERGTGAFVNPENYTAPAGLSYVGVSVPLAQGLLLDERRAAVRQAQALQGLAEAERRGALNKLLLQAAKDYWEWTLSYQRQELLRQNAELAAVRLGAIRERVRQGDLAAIDSIEALMELQNRQAQLVQARVQWQNATLQLSNYLWDEQQQPRELPAATVRPQPLPSPADWQPLPPDSLAALAEQARKLHPELQKSRAKLAQLGVESRLLRNKLLPKLTLDYNLLQAGPPFGAETGLALNSAYLQNNYKLGLSFAYPLLLRQERSKLQLNALKRRDTELELQQDAREVQTTVRTVANDWEALRAQLRLQEQVGQNAERLRQGEQTRFESGESSVFLLNARETALVSARLKLAELQAKYAQTQATLRWAAGGSN